MIESLGDFNPHPAMWLQEVNWRTGYVCGSMRAENVPQAKTPVVTFWEGDIIDNVNHSFITSKWGAEKKVDVKHWRRFNGFQTIGGFAEAACGRCVLQESYEVSVKTSSMYCLLFVLD